MQEFFEYFRPRYWTWPRIVFTVFYSALMVLFSYSSYKTFTIPKEDVKAIILNKTTGFKANGIPRYFVEVQSGEKIWLEEISYKFEYDTMNIHKEVSLQVFQKKSYAFCGLSLISLLLLIVYGSPFMKLILKLKENVL